MSELNEQAIIESHLARGDDLDPNRFPELGTLSSAFLYQFTPVAKQPAPPEIVFLPVHNAGRLEVVGVLASWNHLWEAAQYRKEGFNQDRFAGSSPELLGWIERLPEANIYLIAETKTKYDAYAPLLHLLPRHLLVRHCLPALKRPIWPANAARVWNERILPNDFASRLSRAFAEHIWHYLDSGSGLRAFSSTDPLILLSHSLDFWLPHAITVIEDRMRDFERVEPETPKQRRILARARKRDAPDVAFERPRKGGVLWMGEDEAAYATQEILNAADRGGQLRGLIEAVRSNRVVDDFSPVRRQLDLPADDN